MYCLSVSHFFPVRFSFKSLYNSQSSVLSLHSLCWSDNLTMSIVEEEEVHFKWGAKKGMHKGLQFYESFMYKGVNYNLYDCVYVYHTGGLETDIGKLVEVYETPNHEKQVKLVWFLRPKDVQRFLNDYVPSWNEIFLASGEGKGLSNVNPLEVIIDKCNVLCTSNDRRNPRASEEELRKADYIFRRTFDVAKLKIEESFLEEIDGVKVEHFFNRKKSQASVNRLNSPVSVRDWAGKSSSPELGLDKAAVDVVKDSNSSIIVDPAVKDSERANISVLEPTNSIRNCQNGQSLPENTDAVVKELRERKVDEDKQRCFPSKKTTLRIKVSGENSMARESFLKVHGVQVKRFSDGEKEKVIINPLNFNASAKERTGKSSSSPRTGLDNVVGGCVVKNYNSGTRLSPVVKEKSMIRQGQPPRPELFVDKDKFEVGKLCCSQLKKQAKVRYLEDLVPASASVVPLKKRKCHYNENESNKHDKLHAQCVQKRGTKPDSLVLEATPKPDSNRGSYFKQLPWETRLQNAYKSGTVLSLENLNPSYTSSEVEDLIWHALQKRVEAKMLQRTAFSSPYNGKALVIFKTKDAAESVMEELSRRCLMLEDGRPVVCSRPILKEPSKAANFSGHLILDKVRRQKLKDQEMRTALSTSHCSQINTIEYEMAMEWRLLQEKSDLRWKALYEKQEKQIRHLKSQLKMNYSGKQCHSERSESR